MNRGGSEARVLGVLSLAMTNVAAVLSLPNFPSMAVYGWSSIGWYVIGAISFLIPLTLAGAELASSWPQGGGVYAWVREAFGEKLGFIAVFCEWSSILVWFPTVLAFIASTFFFAFDPNLANNGVLMFAVMMIAFWGTTIISNLGERASSRFGTFGVIAGSMVPAVLIIALGLLFKFTGKPTHLPPLTLFEALPAVNLGTLPFIATMVLLFAGMEMAGFHALAVRAPQRNFPRLMAISALIVFALTVLGTLAIAIVVPVDSLSLAAGLMQAFQVFLEAFNLAWLLAPLAVLVAIGGLATLASWLAGLALGLGAVADDGNMPPLFQRRNRSGAPTGVLILQAVLGTAISLLYVFIPSINATYWVLSALAVLLGCIVYLMVFAALIKLRYSQPDTPRAFRVPGGMVGVWIIGGLGLLASGFTFLVCLLPPGDLGVSKLGYAAVMIIGTAALALPPLVFLALKKPSWKANARAQEA